MKILFLAVLSFCCLNANYLAAENCSQKRYVDPKEIQIDGNKILLKTKNGLFPIKSLHSDKNGVYIVKPTKKGKFVKSMYYCPQCRRYVESDDSWHYFFH